MWGWTMPKATCFEMLDFYYKNGFRQIDTATNYPINKIPEDFRRAENILLEWINSHEINDLQVIVKIGSINNLRSPEHNLSKSFILMNLDDYQYKYASNFNTLMIHWDNRNNEMEIRETLEGLDAARNIGLAIGLSGILHPEIYIELNKEFNFDFHIQLKHNLLQSDYPRYKAFHGKPRFTTYGMNAGGIKLDKSEYHNQSSLKARGGNVEVEHPIAQPLRGIIAAANKTTNRAKLDSMNQIGMLYAYHSPDVESLLIGPSNLGQLNDSLEFYTHLQSYDYSDVFEQVRLLSSDF